jgi:hypothetical protein
MPLANFKVVQELTRPEFIVIRDLGPWDRYQTVTNAVESVVDTLRKDGLLPAGRRLFYFDSEGSLDEIVVHMGHFVKFLPLTKERSHWGTSIVDRDGIELMLIEAKA